MGLAVTCLVGTGCKHTPYGVTPLPNRPTPVVQEPSTSPMIPGGGTAGGSGITGSGLGEGNAGIPLGPGHTNWNRDTTQFQADVVYFDFDSSAIKTSEKSKIEDVANYLKSNPAAAVEVQGNCDERGTEEYNRALGERRALAVRTELIRLGIAPDRVDTISYGKDRPVDPGHTESAWRKNRRDDFVLLTPPK